MCEQHAEREATARDVWELASDLEGACSILSSLIDALDILSGEKGGPAERRLGAISSIVGAVRREFDVVDTVMRALYDIAAEAKEAE